MPNDNTITKRATSRSTGRSMVEANINVLSEGLELLETLDTDEFRQCFKPAFVSTIGAHFRHVLEHYQCFFKHQDNNYICYDERDRDQILEQDKNYTVRTINELILKFEQFGHSLFARQIQMSDQQASGLVATNVARELLFLQSHTVHHYAIIAAMVRIMGKQTKSGFGIAISTRNYLAQQNRLQEPCVENASTKD